MKKAVLAALLVIALLLSLVACKGAPVSNNKPEFGHQTGAYTVNGSPLTLTAAENAYFAYDAVASLTFRFKLPSEQYRHIEEKCTDLCFYASVSGADGQAVPAAFTDLGYVLDNRLIEVSLGGIFSEDYLTAYTVTLSLEFIDESGVKQGIASTSMPTTVYDVAYREYCDRNAVQSDKYPFFTGSDYSPYENLSDRYAVLSSALILTRLGDRVSGKYENGVYESIYTYGYFDGILTVGMKNGTPVNPNLLKKLTVNGEDIYFEIHDGVIRVVLEAQD